MLVSKYTYSELKLRDMLISEYLYAYSQLEIKDMFVMLIQSILACTQ